MALHPATKSKSTSSASKKLPGLEVLSESEQAVIKTQFSDYQLYRTMEKEAGESKKVASTTILGILLAHELEGVVAFDCSLRAGQNVTHPISVEKLLEKGVPMETILYATETKYSEPFLKVTTMKKKEG